MKYEYYSPVGGTRALPFTALTDRQQRAEMWADDSQQPRQRSTTERRWICIPYNIFFNGKGRVRIAPEAPSSTFRVRVTWRMNQLTYRPRLKIRDVQYY